MQGQLYQTAPLEAEASATALYAAGILPDLPPDRQPESDPVLEEPPAEQAAEQPAANKADPSTEQLPPLTTGQPPESPQAETETAPEIKEAYRVANIFEHMADVIGIKLAKRISNDSTEKLYGAHPEKGWNWALGYEKSPQSAVTLNKANRTIAIIVLLLTGFTIYGFCWAYFVKPQIENAQAEGTNSIYIPGSYGTPNGSAPMPITGQYAPTPLPTPFPATGGYGQQSPYGQPTTHYSAQPTIHYSGQPTQHYAGPTGHYSGQPGNHFAPAQAPVYQPYPLSNYPTSTNPVYSNPPNYTPYAPPPPPRMYATSPDHTYGQPNSMYQPQPTYAPQALPNYPTQYGAPPAREERNRVRVITGR